MLGWGAPPGPPTFLRDLNSPQIYYGQRTPAVDRLCLGIPPGEVRAQGRLPCAGAVRGCPTVCPLPSTEHLLCAWCPSLNSYLVPAAFYWATTGRQHLSSCFVPANSQEAPTACFHLSSPTVCRKVLVSPYRDQAN